MKNEWPFGYTQPIRFFCNEMKNLQSYPNGHSLFYREIQNFTVVLKRLFVFLTSKYKISLFIINFFQVSFIKNGKKMKTWFRDILFHFFRKKNKLRSIIELWINFIHKKIYKNTDYRKLVLGFYNGFLKPVVYCRNNHCKKVSPQFFSALYMNISIFKNYPLSLFENANLVVFGVVKEY